MTPTLSLMSPHAMPAADRGGLAPQQWLIEDDVAAVAEVLRGPWLTQGPTIERFEAQMARLCGAKFGVAFSSGTAALHARSACRCFRGCPVR